MRGREEHEYIANQRTEELIANYPFYIQDFYVFMENKSYTTKRKYILYILHMLKFIKGTDYVELEDVLTITADELQKYMLSLKYQSTKDGEMKKIGSSIRAVRWSAIAYFYDFLVKRRHIEYNIFSQYIERPKLEDKKDIIYLTNDEITKFLEYVSETAHPLFRNRDLAIITLAIATGLRETAVTEINISDINFTHGSIYTTNKGNKSWYVYPGEMSMNYIKAWLKDREGLLKESGVTTDALFISRSRQRMTAHTLMYMLKGYTDIFDKHITFHKLRSTCATNLYKASNDIYLVAETLGHASTKTTQRYTKLGDERRREAGAIMNNLFINTEADK